MPLLRGFLGLPWPQFSLLVLCVSVPGASPTPNSMNGNNASHSIHRLETGDQTHFVVGVLANRGVAKALADWNLTFGEYLTVQAGASFEPPLTFEMAPLTFNTVFTQVEAGLIDFVFVNPSQFSCIESQYGANALVTLRNFRAVNDVKYELTKFGGVIVALTARSDITSVADIKGKVIAVASLSGLGSGQAQFRVLERAGVSFLQDPVQVIFTSNQNAVVQLVEQGVADFGFVRTDQIEGMDSKGLTSRSNFKVIDEVEAQDFPFDLSTDLYPEWPAGSLSHVDWRVQQHVLQALMQLDESHPAAVAGSYAGFKPAASYMSLRNMHEELGYIEWDMEHRVPKCIRSSSLYEGLVCPKGYFKKSMEEVEAGCQTAGRQCPVGSECLCHPCVKGFEYDLIPPVSHANVSSDYVGCRKMLKCVEMEQTENLIFTVKKNIGTVTPEITYNLHTYFGQRGEAVAMSNQGEFRFELNTTDVGTHILEVLVDGEQLPQSPVFVKVLPRDCTKEHGEGTKLEPTSDGHCRCRTGSVHIGSDCVLILQTLLPAILAPVLCLVFVTAFLLLRRQWRALSSLSRVKLCELLYDDPPEILGYGTFGLVVAAEYRGTRVAVKQVLPTKSEKRNMLMRGLTRKPQDCPTGAHSPTLRALTQYPQNASMSVRLPSSSYYPVGKGQTKTVSIAVDIADRGRRSIDGEISLASRSTGGSMDKDHHFPGSSYGLYDSVASNAASCFGCSHFNQQRSRFLAEIQTLSQLRHPCIIAVLGAVVDGSQGPLLIMELMRNGSLHDLLMNSTVRVEGELVLPVLQDVAQGLRFLHATDPPLVHGDLKSANILVDDRFRAKVADFGLTQKKDMGLVGTPAFLAPELLRSEALPSPETDVYAFAIVLCEIYGRQDPYLGEDMEEVLARVADGNQETRCKIPDSAPPEMVALIKECWHGDPSWRPKFCEIDRRLQLMDVERLSPLAGVSYSKRRKQSHDLLSDMFPPHVAQCLSEGRKVEPDVRDMTSIFFSDVVNFTDLSSKLPAAKISDMLDRLYSQFDELSQEHQVYKVETIGDAFLGITNLAEDQEHDHAVKLAKFALGVRSAAEATVIDPEDPSLGCVKIRIGLHCGPVVGNIVGTRKPKYTLFGDSVNTASRMESNSLPGRIHMSERFAKLLLAQCPMMEIEKRGRIEVKGKGKMKTYWLLSERHSLDMSEMDAKAANSHLFDVTTHSNFFDTTTHSGMGLSPDFECVPEGEAYLTYSERLEQKYDFSTPLRLASNDMLERGTSAFSENARSSSSPRASLTLNGNTSRSSSTPARPNLLSPASKPQGKLSLEFAGGRSSNGGGPRMDPAIPELNEEESSGAGDLFPGRTVSASVVSSGRNESEPLGSVIEHSQFDSSFIETD